MKSNIKNLTSFKLESTAPNMSQHVATRWPIESSTQQCCDMLRWHVTIVWPGLKTRKFRLRSFGVIQIRISDPRSVWIMVHQRNRRIHSGHGFTGSFDVPWFRQILNHWSGSESPQSNAAYRYSGSWGQTPLTYCTVKFRKITLGIVFVGFVSLLVRTDAMTL